MRQGLREFIESFCTAFTVTSFFKSCMPVLWGSWVTLGFSEQMKVDILESLNNSTTKPSWLLQITVITNRIALTDLTRYALARGLQRKRVHWSLEVLLTHCLNGPIRLQGFKRLYKDSKFRSKWSWSDINVSNNVLLSQKFAGERLNWSLIRS